MSEMYQQDIRRVAGRYLVVGTREAAHASIAEFADAGIEHPIIQVAAPNVPARERVIRTLTDQVLPEFSFMGRAVGGQHDHQGRDDG